MDQAMKSYIQNLVREAVSQSMSQRHIQKARRQYVLANWKMHKTLPETVEYFHRIADSDKVNVVICPPAQLLYPAQHLVKEQGKKLQIGAQNVHVAEKGAYTGEISAAMLKDIGCSHVLIGHSERRQYANETDQTVNQKVKQAMKVGLTPIICIGETIEQKKNAQTERVLTAQILGSLQDIEVPNAIFAYEPVWAIGTGESAAAEEVQRTHAYIRAVLSHVYGQSAESIPIVYGGSVHENNAKDFSAMPDIDGVLVGGASLDVKNFEKIIAVFAEGDV